jgi:autotransporter-associated beta strand protein
MKAKRTNPLFAGFFRRNVLASSVVLSFGLASAIHAQTLYWDANGDTGGSGNVGGTWDTGTNWTTDALGASATVGWTNGQAAVFSAGTDGIGGFTVTVGGTVATPSILFEEAGGKTISGGTITIGGGTINTAAAGNGNTVTISSILAGSGGLSVAANGDLSDTGGGVGGRLNLSGNNTFTGDVTITSGLVRANSSFGAAGNKVILNGGGLLDDNQNINFTRNIEVGAGGGVYRTYGSVSTGQITGAITGTGDLRRTDGGTLTLNADFSGFNGTLTNGQGTLVIGAASATTLAGVAVVQRDGGNVLRLGAAGDTSILSLTSDRDVTVPFGSRLNIVNGTYTTVGAGTTFNGFWAAGTTAGVPAATGEITSSSGTLTFTNGAPTGNLTTTDNRIRLKITNFGSGANPTLAVVKNNQNSLALDMPNTYSGGTTINGGRINADNLSAFGTGTVTVNNGGQAWLTQLGTYANSFVINGDGVAEGSGQQGAIRFQGNTISGGIQVASAARIAAPNSTGVHTGALTGSADLNLNLAASPGTLSFTGNTGGYTGTMTLNSGTVNIGSSGLGGGFVLNTGTANFAGSVVGPFVISGGTVSIAQGANVGGDIEPTNVSTVNIGGSVTGDVTLGTGDTLGLNGGSIVGNLTLGLNSLDAITLNSAGSLSVTGNIVVVQDGVMTVNLLNAPTPGNPLVLMTYTGSFSGDINDFVLANAAAYRNPVLSHNDGAKAIEVSVDTADLVWNGNVSNAVNLTDANWIGADSLFHPGDAITFNDNASVLSATFGGLVAPRSVTFNHDLNYSLTGGANLGFTGTTGITKSGAGILTLGGAGSNFTGPVTVNQGVLNLGNGEALGFNSGITIADGARVNLNGHAPSNQGRHYTWTIAGNGSDGAGGLGAILTTGGDVFAAAGILNLVLAGNAEIGGNNGRFDIGRSGNFYGVITGNGNTLTKVGSNQMVFRAPASGITYVVNAGRLTFEDYDSASGSNPITVNNTGELGTWGGRTIANDVTLNPGTKLISAGGDGTWAGTITANGAVTLQTDSNLILTGALAGSGTIGRTGANTLFLQANGSGFGGKISNPAGAIRIGSPTALGTAVAADVLTLGDGVTLTGGNSGFQSSIAFGGAGQGITQTGNVTYDAGAGNTMTIHSPITGVGNIIKANNSGNLVLNGSVASTGNMTAGGGALTIGGSLTLTDSVNGILRTENANTLVYTGSGSLRRIQVATSTVQINPGANVSSIGIITADGGSTASVINHAGGNFTITGTDNSDSTGRSFLLGHWGSGGASTAYNLSAGNLNSIQATMGLGWDSANVVFNQSGGTSNLLGIDLASGRNNFAQVNLTGGRMNLGAQGINDASAKQVNLGGGTLGAFADWTASKPLVLSGTNGSVIVNTLDSADNTTARTITFSAALSGPGGLTKTGAGTLIAEIPTNVIGGTVRVEEGLLRLNTSASSAGTIELAGGDFRTSASFASSLNFAGGNATFNVGGSGSLITTQALTVSAPSTIAFVPQGLISVNDEFPIISYQGTIGGLGLGQVTLTQLPNPRYQASLVNDTIDQTVNVRIDSIDSLVWTGSQSNVWNDSTPNWKLASNNSAATFLPFDSVLFDGATPGTISLSGSLAPGLITVNSSANYIFSGSGSLAGSAALLKTGTGVLTLLTANSYTGETTVNGGTLRVANSNATGAAGTTTRIGAAGTLDVNGQDLEASNVLVRSAGTITNSSVDVAKIRRLQLDGNTTLNVANPMVVGAFAGTSGVLELGGNTLVKNGAGQLTLNGVTVGDGSITINQGTLRLMREYNNNQQPISITGSGAITVNAGASLITNRWAPAFTLSKAIVLNGGTIGSDWPGPNGATIASPVTVAADSTMNFGGG